LYRQISRELEDSRERLIEERDGRIGSNAPLLRCVEKIYGGVFLGGPFPRSDKRYSRELGTSSRGGFGYGVWRGSPQEYQIPSSL